MIMFHLGGICATYGLLTGLTMLLLMGDIWGLLAIILNLMALRYIYVPWCKKLKANKENK